MPKGPGNAAGGRSLRRDGVTMAVPVYIELRNWLNLYFLTRAYERAGRGLESAPGEKKGAGLALGRVACWLASLCDEDIERIQEEGGALLAAMDALPPDYGMVPGRADVVAIERRAASVFAVETCAEVITDLFRYGGGRVLSLTHPMQRHLRNSLAARQHVAVTEENYEIAGRERIESAKNRRD